MPGTIPIPGSASSIGYLDDVSNGPQLVASLYTLIRDQTSFKTFKYATGIAKARKTTFRRTRYTCPMIANESCKGW